MTNSVGVIVLSVLACLGLAGLLLIWRGLSWRHKGDGERRCRTCEYIIDNIPGGCCPECGAAIKAENTVVGRRQRSWLRIILGVILLAGGVLPLVGVGSKVNWYQWKPSFMVLADVSAPGMGHQAMTELVRRDDAGRLPQSVRQKLIALCLAEQAGSGSRSILLEYLADQAIADKLDEQQLEQFYRNARRLKLTVRQVAEQGEPLSFWAEQQGRSPSHTRFGKLWIRTGYLGWSVDGGPRRGGGGYSSTSGGGGGGSGSSITVDEIGRHTLEYYYSLDFWLGPHGDKAGSRLLRHVEESVSAEFEVVRKGEAPPVTPVWSAELEREVAGAIRASNFRMDGGTLVGELVVSHLPCDLAFEVFVDAAEPDNRIGMASIALTKGPKMMTYMVQSRPLTVAPGKTITLILRPSPEIARRSVDLWEYYSRDIVIADVPVEGGG